MLAIIFWAVGGVLFLFGVLGRLRSFMAPYIHARRIAYEREDDYMKFENEKGQQRIKESQELLGRVEHFCMAIGAVLILVGFYCREAQATGFQSENGYEKAEEDILKDEHIDEKGNYVLEDQSYAYYVEIKGTKVRCFNGATGNCIKADFSVNAHGTISELIEQYKKSQDIPNGSQVLVIDDYGSSAVVSEVQKELSKKGLRSVYEEK
ncbi:MAG: hypothetical protein MJ124_04010 [Lachnospiraceae bacterium]|nr:hypothetical protein [Lachnospiraceae bacterium]